VEGSSRVRVEGGSGAGAFGGVGGDWITPTASAPKSQLTNCPRSRLPFGGGGHWHLWWALACGCGCTEGGAQSELCELLWILVHPTAPHPPDSVPDPTPTSEPVPVYSS
jgi:hypothetical protein